VVTWTGGPVHDGLLRRLIGQTLSAAPFRTDHVSGWAFFVDPAEGGVETLPLLEVIGREVGGSIDHALAYDRGRELAVAEDRIARARDLHDGILQSLTGVRLELQALAMGDSPDSRRLVALEQALAVEQRDLRRVIDGHGTDMDPGTLASRLEELGRRMAFDSRAPISIQVRPRELVMPDRLTHAVTFLTHEAISNALRHAMPTRVTVGISAIDDTLTIDVRDDGRGFSFRGRRTHDDLTASGDGPVSLRERVASLGGQLSVESASTGSRVVLVLPLETAHAR
jgi:signal transduction histidine kinase